jgi:hypothetical protein
MKKARRGLLWALLALAGCDSIRHPDVMLVLKELPEWTATSDDPAIRGRHPQAMVLYERPSEQIAVWWGMQGSGGILLSQERFAQHVTALVQERGTTPDGIPPTVVSSRMRLVDNWKALEYVFETAAQRRRLCFVSGPDRSYTFEAVSSKDAGTAGIDQAFDQILSTARFSKVYLGRLLGPFGSVLLAALIFYFRVRFRRRDRPAIDSV